MCVCVCERERLIDRLGESQRQRFGSVLDGALRECVCERGRESNLRDDLSERIWERLGWGAERERERAWGGSGRLGSSST